MLLGGRGKHLSAQGAFLDFVDLVADVGGFLELQVLRVLVHARFELLEQRGDLFGVHRGVVGVRFGNAGACRIGLAAAFAAGDVFAVGAFHDVGDAALDGARRDAVFAVVFDLFFATARGFVHGGAHRARDFVGVEDGLAAHVAGGAADGLDQRAGGAQDRKSTRLNSSHVAISYAVF